MTKACSQFIRTVVGAGIVAAAVALTGCGKHETMSEFEREKLAEQDLNESLTAQGAKLKSMRYPIGTAWSVNLSGLTITDDMLRQVRKLGPVSEMNLSKSTVTDDQLGLMQELQLTMLLNKLDLSNTAVSDAGIDKLDGMKFLAEMNLVGTKVTPAAVDRFKKKQRTDPRVIARFKNPTVRLR